MFYPLPSFIALRYIRAARKGFVSFISLVSMLGMALGVLALITVLAIMNGFQKSAAKRILGLEAHLTISHKNGVDNWQKLATKLKQNNAVADVAPYVELQGMLAMSGNMQAVSVIGFDPNLENNVSEMLTHLVSGDVSDIKAQTFKVMLGRTLANNLNLEIGSSLMLVLPQTSNSGALVPKLQTVEVAAIFATGLGLDAHALYLHINDAAKLENLDAPKIGGVRLKLHDFKQAANLSLDLAAELGTGFEFKNWTHTRGSLFAAMQMEKTMISLLLSLIIAVAAFNIVAGLSMAVHQKTADIAILRTMGASSKQILAIFMLQGVILGLVGTFLGAILGVLLVQNLGAIGDFLSSLNLGLLGANPYFMQQLPTSLQLSDVLIICALALGLSILAAFYPARQAAKLDPANLLRSV